MAAQSSVLSRVLERHGDALLAEWVKEQLGAPSRGGVISEPEVRQQCAEFLRLLRDAVAAGASADLAHPEWEGMRELLEATSRSRSAQGFTPTETAMLVFSLRRPLFARLRAEAGASEETLADEIWSASALLDRLGLHTTEAFVRAREAMIARQQEEMLELSTPVVKLWDGILALPMIGTLDSSRTQVVMETLLQKIVETGSAIAIIDITGVPTVDTLVAQHLLKTVAAARLMGAECIISGIRPQIAQTIVHLAIDLGDVVTKATLADAFKAALGKLGHALAAS